MNNSDQELLGTVKQLSATHIVLFFPPPAFPGIAVTAGHQHQGEHLSVTHQDLQISAGFHLNVFL